MQYGDFYADNFSRLMRFAQRLSGNAWDSEDLLQEAFARLFVNHEKMKDWSDDHIRSWMYRVIRNLFTDLCRKHRFETVMEEVPQPGFQESADAGIICRDLVSRLPAKFSVLVRMKFFEGLNSRQIAARTGKPDSTVRRHLSQALSALRCQDG